MSGQYAPVSLKAEDAFIRPVWSILSKGLTGNGKTIASCGKEFRPVYVFNCEGRFESVLSYYRKLDGHVKDVYYNDYTLDGGFFPLDQKMDAIAARPEYKTVVVSSLTSFIRLIMLHLIKSVAPKSDGSMKGIRQKGGIRVNILEDYNFEDAAIINELIGFFQNLKSQGINVILEAHITPYEIKSIDEESGQKDLTTIFEILTKGKKAPAEVPSWFNEVWLFEKKIEGWDSNNAKAKYIINPLGNSTNSCKTSFGIKPFEWTDVDPTIKLMSFLSQEIKDTPVVDPNTPKRVGW
jgi:hypothetical protein